MRSKICFMESSYSTVPGSFPKMYLLTVIFKALSPQCSGTSTFWRENTVSPDANIFMSLRTHLAVS